jgi:antitoxin ParD1/3/4
MARKTIEFGETLDNYINLAVTQGGYTSEAEYLRYLVRKDEEKHRDFLELREELQKGLDSGVSGRSFEEIWGAGKKRWEAQNKAHKNA